jgi:hypothetical protein
VEGSAGSRVATVSFSAALPTPAYGGNSFNVLSAGTGYVVGDTVTLDIGVSAYNTLTAVQRVEEVLAVSGTVSNLGSGSSVSGVCGVIGTLGTIRTGGKGRVQALVTVTGGSIDMSSGFTIIQGGDYTQNPLSNIESLVGYSNSASITACTGLTGASASLTFGVFATTPVSYGYYPRKVSVGTAGTQTATSGHGMGVTLTTASDFFSVSGTVTWGTDDTTAFSNGVSLVNSARQHGINALLYVPPGECDASSSTSCALGTLGQTGAYFFGPGSALPLPIGNPAFTYGGGIVTDGDNAVTFYMSPIYAPNANPSFSSPLPLLRPLIWWHADGPTADSFGPSTASFSNQFGPSLNGGITIVGDTTSNPLQVGMAFCGSNYFAEIHDYQFRNLPGTGLLYGCLENTDTQSHNRESRFYNIRGFNSGASPGSIGGTINYPAIDINTQVTTAGNADMDDVGFNNVELFGNHGTGIIIHASHGLTNTMTGGYTPGSISFVNFTGRLRVEGLAPDGTTLDGPLIQIGDTSQNQYAQVMDGAVSHVSFPDGMQLVDPYAGYAAFLVTGTGSYGLNNPADVTTGPGTSVTGGPAYGNGFDIEYCIRCNFNIQYIQVSGTSYIQGPASRTGTVTLQTPAGITSNWSTNIDPAAVISQPAAFLSTGGLAASTAALAVPIVTPLTGTVSVDSLPGSWTTTVNQVTGSYFSIGPLTCVNFIATFSASSISGTAGQLDFPLPVAPALDAQAIAISGLQGYISWPMITGGGGFVQSTQIQFFPTQHANYGRVGFAASTANLVEGGGLLKATSLSTGTTYTVSVNGCYR